jgi:proline iminopeptidase
MSKFALLLFLLIPILQTFAQSKRLYSRGYGNPANPAVIFIHGGPSGNATLFESTTAQKLAEKGFYVIAYDRRGEGRSVDSTATLTYLEAENDLLGIFKHYHIKRAHLLAHSFGGLVATLFTEKHPDQVRSLTLSGALFAQQDTYDHILSSIGEDYRKRNEVNMLEKISRISGMNRGSAEYRKACFDLAGENNFFNMPDPTRESILLRSGYEQSSYFKGNIRNQRSPVLFYQNEKNNNIDVKPILATLKRKGTKLFGVYGNQDKIFSPKQLQQLIQIVGKHNFQTIDNCSHYLFVDQQTIFLNTITTWLREV